MTTFSQMVDDLVVETSRHDMRVQIAAYLNQTIREVHFTADNGGAIFYKNNRIETQIIAASESSLVWEIPDETVFQALAVVRYDSVSGDNCQPIYPREYAPGRILSTLSSYYYRAGSEYAFAGFGGLNAVVNLMYYNFPRRMLYHDAATRLASYDPEAGWTYRADITTPEMQLVARSLCSNWLLMRWSDVISEGLRAKIYKRTDDTNRARTCYSMFQSLRQGLFTSESSDLEGYR